MGKTYSRQSPVYYTVEGNIVRPDRFPQYAYDYTSLSRPLPPEPPAPRTYWQRLKSRLSRAPLHLPKIKTLNLTQQAEAPSPAAGEAQHDRS